MKDELMHLGMAVLMGFVILLAIFYIYNYIDETTVYEEIKNGILPKEPYDKIDHIEYIGQANDGWYLANIFVVNSMTNDFANNLVRYNRNTKEFIIPSEQFGFEPYIEIKLSNPR